MTGGDGGYGGAFFHLLTFQGAGGVGAYFAGNGATFVNSGVVIGGSSFGAGAYFAGTGAKFINRGTVTGGSIYVYCAFGCSAREAGAGAYFAASGATFVNSGIVTGGAGAKTTSLGPGGTGVVANGLTLINSGTISGGLSGDGKTRGSAMVFARGSNVVESRPGSRIIGNVHVKDASLALKGTMAVAGSLTFKPGSSLLTEIGSAKGSYANVSGVALLDGALMATFAPGALLRRSYNVLHADRGLQSTRFTRFASLGVPSNFHGALRYGVNDVWVNLTSVLGAGAALTHNGQSVATSLNDAFNAGGTFTGNFSNLYALTGTGLSGALTSISGEAATGAQQTAFRATEQFLAAMLDPTAAGRDDGAAAPGPALAFAPERALLTDDIARAYTSVLKAPAFPAPAVYQPRWTSWASAFGGYNRLGGDPTGAGSHTLSGGSFGVAGGFDYHVSRDTLLGAALAGGGTNWGLSEGLGGGGSSVLHAGAYASTRMGPAYLSGAFAFANHWMTTARNAAFGDALSASFDAQTYGGRVEGGYRLATPAGDVTPYAAMQTQSFVAPGYAETGALIGGFGLAHQGRAASDTRTELGAKLDHVVALQPDLALALRGRLAWAHDWVSDPTLLATFQTLPGAGFLVEGALPVKNAALVSSAVELRFADGVTLGARFDGGLAPRGQSYAGTIGLRYSW